MARFLLRAAPCSLRHFPLFANPDSHSVLISFFFALFLTRLRKRAKKNGAAQTPQGWFFRELPQWRIPTVLPCQRRRRTRTTLVNGITRKNPHLHHRSSGRQTGKDRRGARGLPANRRRPCASCGSPDPRFPPEEAARETAAGYQAATSVCYDPRIKSDRACRRHGDRDLYLLRRTASIRASPGLYGDGYLWIRGACARRDRDTHLELPKLARGRRRYPPRSVWSPSTCTIQGTCRYLL